MKVTAVTQGSVLQVRTDEWEWPQYRRYSSNTWQVYMGGSWKEIKNILRLDWLEAAYQKFVRKERAEPPLETERNAPQRPVYKPALSYRRCAGVWEGKIAGITSWSPIDDPAMLAELEGNYQKSMSADNLEDMLKDPGRRYTDDFEWKASREIEPAQADEMLTYLAGIGGIFYPSWAWIAFDTVYGYAPASLFKCDQRGLKVRQWRGQGFSTHGLLTNGGKWGVILVICEEELVRVWRQSSRHKLEFAKQITRETIEHARLVAEGDPYPEFVPTIKHCEEDAKTDAGAA